MVACLVGSECSYHLLVTLTAECLAVWGFRGVSPSPPWVSLQTGQGDEFLGLLERYLPMNLESYSCSPRSAQSRKDLELLRTATAADWLMWTPLVLSCLHTDTQTHNQLMNVNCWTFNLLTVAKNVKMFTRTRWREGHLLWVVCLFCECEWVNVWVSEPRCFWVAALFCLF